ncbi:MAG: TonB-dependent receptor, partial [Pseudomonadota bacterium]
GRAQGGGGRPGAGGPPRRRRSGRPGSLRFAVFHTWTLQDEVLIAEGVPVFDFLDGSAGGALGGTSAHVLNANMGRWNNGLGIFANLNYASPTEVAAQSGLLRFSDLVTADLRIGYEFNYSDKIVNAVPFLEETRLALNIRNILDEKIQVTDETGATPFAFQEDILDPFGRTWRLELRKRF